MIMREVQVQLGRPIGRGSIGLLLVATLDDSLVIKGRQSVVREPSVPPATGVSVAPTASLMTPIPP